MEIAFISSNRLKLELEKKQGKFPAQIITIFSNNSNQFIVTTLVGNAIALVIYGLTMAGILEPYMEGFIKKPIIVVLIQIVISTVLILITTKFLPITFFRNNPNNALNIFAIPMLLLFIILFPIAWFFKEFSIVLNRKFFRIKIEQNATQVAFEKKDLDNFKNENHYDKSQKIEIGHEIKIFQNALDFLKVKVRESMVPRTEIVAIEVNQSIEELLQKFVETGFSKIIIYDRSIDNVIGYVHSSELFKRPKTIKAKLQTLPIIPETMTAHKLLQIFSQQNKRIAAVVDEYGELQGSSL
jgi:CBS domain containing-hemolysin-like protein